jgi:hypothetical protein
LSHGGIPVNEFDNNDINQNVAKNINVSGDFIVDRISSTQIRWNDFHGENNTINTLVRGDNPGGVLKTLGVKFINNCVKNNIHLIIRAHQDNDANTKILRVGNIEPVSIHEVMKTFINKRCEEHINSFYFDGDKLKLKKIDDESIDILPVITLSNAIDTGKNLTRDSYIILKFENLVEPKCN